MFSKQVVFSKQSLGVVVTAVAVGFGLLIGVAGPSRAQDKDKDKPAAPTKNWKDPMEYDVANAPLKEPDNKKKLDLLNKWKQLYPATEYLDERRQLFLSTYAALGMARETFDEAQEILKAHPTNFAALAQALQNVMKIKPAPSPADLDTGEKNCLTVLDDPGVFAASAKPPTATDAVWASTKTNVQNYAKTILLEIYLARKDDKRAVQDITKLINRDPNMGTAAYSLGDAMNHIIQADKTPQNEPPMFWQFARAIDLTGANSVPQATKDSALKFLTSAYTGFHGSADGLQDLLTQAKSSPFPPAGWSIKSTVDIANEQEAKRLADQKADPVMFLWTQTIKEGLLGPNSDAVWASLMGAGLPGPDPEDKSEKPEPRYFTATIVSMSPNPKPKEIVVALEKPGVADATLDFDKPLEGKMEPGEKIQFKGVVKSWTKDPYMITFDVDAKEDMNGTWTGKNAPAPRGRGPAAGKGGTKAAPPKGPTK